MIALRQTERIFRLFAHAPLMSGRNFHVFAVFRHCPPGDLNAFGLQASGDLLVSQRLRGIFFLDHLLYPAFQDQQRSRAAGWALHRFGEEVSQLENTLRRVGVLRATARLTVEG